MEMMGIIDGIVKRTADNVSSIGKDFIGTDGLIYCGKCGKAKQKRVEIMGNEIIPFVPCACELEKQRQEEEERRRWQWEQRVLINRMSCFPDERLMNWNFDNSDGDEPTLKIMRKYCDNFDEFYRSGKGLILYGNVGVGKTYAAACVANELVDHGREVYMTDFSRIINTLWGLKEGKQKYLDGLQSYDLLIIDDLAAERDTEYANEIVMSVVDSRCKSGKPLIITTNLSAEALMNPDTVQKKRIYSRLCEMCLPVQCTSTKDRRKKRMSDDMKRYKELLGL